MDSVQGSWPPNATLCELSPDQDEVADVVREWNTKRPSEVREILWYRLPVETDARNWRMATLEAVMSGRRPRHELEIVSAGTNLVDVGIRNAGEADERLRPTISVSGSEAPFDADALTDWHVERGQGASVFAMNQGADLRLRPGETRNIGWLRFQGAPKLSFALTKDRP